MAYGSRRPPPRVQIALIYLPKLPILLYRTLPPRSWGSIFFLPRNRLRADVFHSLRILLSPPTDASREAVVNLPALACIRTSELTRC